MANYVNIVNGNTRYGRHLATNVEVKGIDTTYHIDLAGVPGFQITNGRQRRLRRTGPGPLQRFLDPDREHPILKSLVEAIGPVLQGFVSSQLPQLLSLLVPEEDDD